MQFECLQDGEDGGSYVYVVEALGWDAMGWVEVGAGMCQCARSFVVSKSMAAFQRHCHFSRVGLGDDEPVHENWSARRTLLQGKGANSSPCKADHLFELTKYFVFTLTC
jgi:hypothetical protein